MGAGCFKGSSEEVGVDVERSECSRRPPSDVRCLKQSVPDIPGRSLEWRYSTTVIVHVVSMAFSRAY